MSVHTARGRNNSDGLSLPSSPKSVSLGALRPGSSLRLNLKLEMSECENDGPLLSPAGEFRDINSTYVISACDKPGAMPADPHPVGTLALQRRVTRTKESSLLGSELGASTEKMTERLTLQRRARAGSVDKSATAGADAVDKWKRAVTDAVDKWKTAQNVGGAAESNGVSRETGTNVRIVNNDKTSFAASSVPLAEDPKDTEMRDDAKYKGTFSALSGAGDSMALKSLSHRAPSGSQSQSAVVKPGRSATKPTLGTQVSETGNLHHRSIGRDRVKNSNAFGSLEKRTPTKCTAEHKLTPKCVPQFTSPAASVRKNRVPSCQAKQKTKSSLLTVQRDRPQEATLPREEETAGVNASTERDPLKVENSQVTVAVRVRPFSKREKAENASQVVFRDGEEVVVRHPDMRHVYSFVYDVLFWSFDECHPQHAGQTRVYEALAAPLLARAFEGYNACLFAYGQTGSGKSYTMMGFGEEPGIIPRFCEDLFAQVAKKQSQEVCYHLEMSFFEVYNEKIHDLLVCKGENGRRKQPLRVREHPVSGPYVEALSMNVVSSYSDIQSWLDLGSKQRATAATGMNDKSSRSHSVFTLLLTQTRTEFVDGEEHDHRVTSRINLIDLAGSERCASAQTGGEQLKEGMSINRSLLTLGKVISALSEQANRRRVFIPYRESVLTWLLKESLGGNSKTAMIATVSPAASSVEETLSTLRYANQARKIVNVAKVNEDVNAKLIRELKAEIEKLKAAQRSRQNIDPERYQLCRQEITSLRMKLHQQERDMAEMQRAWKEKFEEAEKRKLQEIKELQKAGVAFHTDDHLPHLVNLSEDPQLSEMLLYVIKEGTATVGRSGPGSSHDIQLSGVLVADDHCTIRNVDGAVTIVPVGEAKTYVNGTLISEATVLHHGDRLVLGGDHYFRFHHPVEAQRGKRLPGRDALPGEGPEDFEFAKNELLAAQRSQLEAEIKEAQLRAKQEMLQGIQIAREMAQQELCSQKAAYESRIETLEAELKEESQRKKMQEIDNQKAHHRIEELERTKQRLEQEVHVSRKRLEVEALAAKQALEDHSVRHTRILEALEAEKQKIAQEVQALQQNQNNREKTFTGQTNWSSMKLSVMIQEANAISNKFKGHYVFGRLDASDGGSGADAGVRVRNLRLGTSTCWSLEKFESQLAAMKELYENDSSNKGEDIFWDPDDEWEPDITNAPVSAFSRRRSRSLVKNRRVSGCLHDIHVHPARNSQSSHPGFVGKSSTAASFLPGICRELIGSSVATLGRSCGEESTMVDSLLDSLLCVYQGLLAVSQAHSDQDEDSPDDLFSSDRATQAWTVRVACAFGQLVVLTMHWPSGVTPDACAARLVDELRQEVKRLGGHLQLFLQGCCSDISSMVKDAQEKAIQVVQRAVRSVGQLAVLEGIPLRFPESSASGAGGVQEDFMDALWDGVGSGMRILLDSGAEKAEELRYELLRQRTENEVTPQMSSKAVALVECLENVFAEWRTKSSRTQAQGENSGSQDLKRMVDVAAQFLKLKHCLEQTIQIITSALRGCPSDGRLLRSCVESLCSVAGGICCDTAACTPDPCDKSCRELASVAKSLLFCFEAEERPEGWKPWEAWHQGDGEGQQPPRLGGTSSPRRRGVPKRVYALPSQPLRSAEMHSPGVSAVLSPVAL